MMELLVVAEPGCRRVETVVEICSPELVETAVPVNSAKEEMAALVGADGRVLGSVSGVGDANAIGELVTKPLADDVETLLDC
jgi:hypothetical protein